MAAAAPWTVTIRIAGVPPFSVELDVAATARDAKIAATAGCDIDPEAMRIIYKGKVLKDEDPLSACGLKAGESLHVARVPTALGSELPAAAAAPPAGPPPEALRVTIKGPGGAEEDLDLASLGPNASVDDLRRKAAALCGLQPEQVHLLLKGKFLRDGQALAQSGLCAGAVVRVARRQAEGEAQPSAAASSEDTAEASGAAGAPMPMAWRSGGLDLPPGVEEQIQAAARATGIPLEQLLGGLPLEQAVALAGAQAAPRRPPAGETAEAMQARFAREAQEMLQRVRAYLAAERERVGPNGQRVAGEANDLPEDDPDLLADIAGTLAEARARGAPVPNAAVFVDRAVVRRRQARALQARLDREASGMEPELEDAFLAAEQSVAAAARAPRRLGHGSADMRPGRGDGQP